MNAEREALEKHAKETETLRSTMQGFVHAEKEKFERLASKMKNKEKDLAIKSQKLRQVEELIKNSPCALGTRPAPPREPLRESNKGESRGVQSCEETVQCIHNLHVRTLISHA